MTELPLPRPGVGPAERFVSDHLAHLCCDPVRASEHIRGGATAAESALAGFDVSGYARRRNEVWPPASRGASQLSPYIRHGLLGLPAVWRAVAGGPERDVRRFRDELLWQEYARHWYATHGTGTRHGIRRELRVLDRSYGWEADMNCVASSVEQLHDDGWLVNQQRMWLASHWAVRSGGDWRRGRTSSSGTCSTGHERRTGLVGSGPPASVPRSPTSSVDGRWRSAHRGCALRAPTSRHVRSRILRRTPATSSRPVATIPAAAISGRRRSNARPVPNGCG